MKTGRESRPAPTSGSSPSQTPKRRFGAGTLVLAMLISAAIAGGGVWWISQASQSSDPHETAPVPADRYQCPMHPSMIQDHPGDCPICGMPLVKMPGGQDKAVEPPVASVPEAQKILFYRSPMDPKVTSPTPKQDEMGMDYLPVTADAVSDVQSPSPVPGQSTVDIDPAHQQMIGLTTTQASVGPVGGAWRTVGRVVIDETRVRHINVKVMGFVERIHVDFVGKAVKKGDPLFAVYSPELLSAQEEYLLALRMQSVLA
ncbi:MAG: efflux RND transporter periplasmic adaptor subunit, partial [Pseudomonadota bacterium]